MDALTLDQIRVFLAVVDEGSFPKAAKSLHRAQSAVTHAIKKLEAGAGVPLFDRSAYRSVLAPVGQALVVRARRIADEAGAFREQARSLASGLEAELTLVLDATYPMPQVVDALRIFAEHFPTVPPRVYVQSLGAAAGLVIDGTCAIGLLSSAVTELTTLSLRPITTIDLVPVVAPCHPLAVIEGAIEPHELDQHVQLVLTDPSALAIRDPNILSSRTWRLADLGAKKAMLIAGLGWGNMPVHLVEEELRARKLKVIRPKGFDPLAAKVVVGAAYVSERSLGPAGEWMLSHLDGIADRQDYPSNGPAARIAVEDVPGTV